MIRDSLSNTSDCGEMVSGNLVYADAMRLHSLHLFTQQCVINEAKSNFLLSIHCCHGMRSSWSLFDANHVIINPIVWPKGILCRLRLGTMR